GVEGGADVHYRPAQERVQLVHVEIHDVLLDGRKIGLDRGCQRWKARLKRKKKRLVARSVCHFLPATTDAGSATAARSLRVRRAARISAPFPSPASGTPPGSV